MGALKGSTAVLVLGMHRSGTSALGGALQHAGVNMGSRLFGPQEGVNERGFFENSGVVAINEALLDRLGAQWDQPQQLLLPADLTDKPSVRDAVTSFLTREYRDSRLWGLKDPRCALLEPLWSTSIRALGATLQRVLICRDPLEVADSLKRRDHFPAEKSLMLWLNYNLAALAPGIDDLPVVLTYRQLVEAPGATLEGLADQLHLPGLRSLDPTAVIETGLYRSQRIDDGPQELRQLASDLYETLSSGQPDAECINDVAERYTVFQASMQPSLLSHLEKVSRREIHYRSAFYEAYDSWWWRLAAPARWIERKLRGRAAPPSPPRR